MKKLFTTDDIMVCFISALGYGFGEIIAKIFGWPPIVCWLASMVLGFLISRLIEKICFSETVQKKPTNRVIAYVSFFLIFIIAQFFSMQWLGVSLLDYLSDQFVSVIGMPILGFVLNLLVRAWRIHRIRKRYGDGSEGYVFNVKEKDLEEANRQNQAITGEYDENCAVRTRTGVYVGERYKKSIGFLGIPYAKPPVGDLRWKAPEPLPASEAVYEAKSFGASAIQVGHSGSIVRQHRQSEDCLTLNIGTGAERTEKKKPVLVVFHRGDFASGGSVDPLLYGGEFASQHPDIVFVTFNYRLGIFGFIDFSQIPGGENYPDAVNLGLLDQIAALKWIRENISAFGGDPEQVTLLGFDSGASSICLLAACEQAKGLFRRAFIFNGSPAAAFNTAADARAIAADLLKETHTSTMEELSRLDTEVLKEAAQKLWGDLSGPTFDGKLIPADVYQAYENGAASGIDFIIGLPSQFAQTLRSEIGEQKYADAVSSGADTILNSLDPSISDAVRTYLEKQTQASSEFEAKSKLVEQWLALSIYRTAVKLAMGGNQVRMLYWDEKALIEKLGSGSVDVAATLLGNEEALEMYGSVLKADLSETLQRMLIKFAGGEEPSLFSNEIKGIDALNWKPFPQALVVSEGCCSCDLILDRLTEIDGLLEYFSQ